MTPRSWLFVPADAPQKMQKGRAGDADALIIDLEDSVAESAKPEARRLAAEFVSGAGESRQQLWVRVNPLSTPFIGDDLDMAVMAGVSGIVAPKVNGASDVLAISARLDRLERARGLEAGSIRILALATETPAAVLNMSGYEAAKPRLTGLTWGAEDLSSAVGALSPRDEQGMLTGPYLLARSLCIFAAAAAEVEAIETVYPAFRDLDGLAAYAGRARRDGFLGMMAIHPAQVAVINAAFTPTAEEVDKARRIVELFAANPGAGALGLDGQMLDRPHLKQAERTLQRISLT